MVFGELRTGRMDSVVKDSRTAVWNLCGALPVRFPACSRGCAAHISPHSSSRPRSCCNVAISPSAPCWWSSCVPECWALPCCSRPCTLPCALLSLPHPHQGFVPNCAAAAWKHLLSQACFLRRFLADSSHILCTGSTALGISIQVRDTRGISVGLFLTKPLMCSLQ